MSLTDWSPDSPFKKSVQIELNLLKHIHENPPAELKKPGVDKLSPEDVCLHMAWAALEMHICKRMAELQGIQWPEKSAA